MASSNLLNQRFEKLIVVKRQGSNSFGKAMWECLCDCGNFTSASTGALNSGKVKSCGCYVLQRLKEYHSQVATSGINHGLSSSTEYRTWSAMIDRCYNTKNISYHRYGGRGITVCERWLERFENFYEDMGVKPSPDHSLDRERNNEGYSKDNCRWATMLEQSNNRANTLVYEHNGEEKSLMDWCRTLQLKYSFIYHRIKILGWEFHEAIQPIEDTLISFNGETKSLYEWCELLKLPLNKTYLRILRGNSFEAIVKE